MSNIIAKHLDKNNLSQNIIKEVDTICAFTGEHITGGIHKKDAIGEKFTDYEQLKYPSDYISLPIYITMANIIPGNKGYNSLRNYSFICNTSELKLLKNSDIIPYIKEPIAPPFYFCISFNNKKHLAYKAKLNYSKEQFTVTTDIGDCLIERHKKYEILSIAEKWYSIVPGKEDTKMQATWFTKEEILKGCDNITRIEQYGDKFFEEDAVLSKYRGTMLMKVLIHCLTKTYTNVENQLPDNG